MPDKPLLVVSAFPDAEAARTAIRTLLSERLAACGTLLAGAESLYTWKGQVETSRETLVLLKTLEGCYPALEQRLRQLHSYEIPEIIGVEISRGNPKYLEWLAASCGCPA